MDQPTKKENEVHCIRFDERRRFMLGTNQGVRIYEMSENEPFKLKYDLKVGSVKICGFSGLANIFYFVSGEDYSEFQDYYLQFFDIDEGKVTATLLCTNAIRVVCMKPDMVVVYMKKTLGIYRYPRLHPVVEMKVADNPKGLLDMAPIHNGYNNKEIVIYPADVSGYLNILDIREIRPFVQPTAYKLSCHKGELSCIALNSKGTRAATASVINNVIKIWDTRTKAHLQRVSSGDAAPICSIAFDEGSNFFCCSNDKGWGFIFKINYRVEYHSYYMRMGDYNPRQNVRTGYVCRTVCAFGIPYTINLVNFDGILYRIAYSTTLNPEDNRIISPYISNDLWKLK